MSRANGWIDIHTHFTPPTTPEEREAQWRGLQEACFLAPQPYRWQPETTLATTGHRAFDLFPAAAGRHRAADQKVA